MLCSGDAYKALCLCSNVDDKLQQTKEEKIFAIWVESRAELGNRR